MSEQVAGVPQDEVALDIAHPRNNDMQSNDIPVEEGWRWHTVWEDVRMWTERTVKIILQYPSTLLMPLLVLAVVMGVGVFGVVAASNSSVKNSKDTAYNAAADVAESLQDELSKAYQPVQSVASYVRTNIYWPNVSAVFPGAAADTFAQLPPGALNNINLLPNCIAAMAYPNSPILGVDYLAIPARRSLVLSIINSAQLTLVGPYPALSGMYRTLATVYQPIFIPNVSADANFGYPKLPTNCTSPNCYSASNRTKLWGLVAATLAMDAVSDGIDPRFVRLVQSGYNYILTTIDNTNGSDGPEVVVVKSGDVGDPVTVTVHVPNNVWTIYISPSDGWTPPWRSGLIVFVVLVAILLALVMFILSISRRQNVMLLKSMVPQNVINKIRTNNMFLTQEDQRALLIDAGTPAEKILAMTSELLEGRSLLPKDILEVRNAILQSWDIYRPVNLGKKIKESALDADVAKALIAQLGNAHRTVVGMGSFSDTQTSVQRDSSIVTPSFSETDGDAVDVYATLSGALHALVYMRLRSPAVHLHTKEPRKSLQEMEAVSKQFSRNTTTDVLELLPAQGSMQSITDMTSPPPPLFEEMDHLLGLSMNSWQFDTFKLAEATQGHPLSTLGFYMLYQTKLIDKFKIQGITLARFLRSLEDGYRQNPYHNKVHAADVLQTAHMIMCQGGLVPGYADASTQLAMYLAAIVHDYEHPGLTNDFLINSADPLAWLYNDRAPLENHHLAASFNVLRRPQHHFLAHLPKAEFDKLRKMIIELVLGTDMKQHFAIISHFTTVHRTSPSGNSPHMTPNGTNLNREASDEFDVGGKGPASTSPPNSYGRSFGGTAMKAMHAAPRRNQTFVLQDVAPEFKPSIPIDEAERLLSLQMALKCADIGHIAAGLEVHLKWVSALEEEFFLQGDREAALGLPISPLFDRSKPGVTKSQVGFFDFVVLPLFKSFSSVFPGTKPALASVMANYRHWTRLQAAVTGSNSNN